MTGTDLNVEELAQRIASGGRDALEQRLRGAYADAAAAHADIVALDDAPTVRCGSICTGTVPIVCC